ncbi:MAG: C45 family peptidase [Bryobacteraceae bacterium]
MKKSAVLALVLLVAVAIALASREPQVDPRLKNAFRRPQQNGWTFVHLEGTPREVGFQHGYLLAPEIREAQKIIALELAQDTKRNWRFFRDAARNDLWPHIETEYREELLGIAVGLGTRGIRLDIWDVVALNAWLEWSPYYIQWHEKEHKPIRMAKLATAERCSAFIATGAYTKDGRIVMAHNTWTGYMDGERWTIVFDISPARGHRILMDGFPGLIHSGDDFGINAAGMMITETTIARFHGWNPNGIPEFVRARKAMQYSTSIEEFAKWMSESNNGGYANNWLVGDRKTNEIASLELGLKNVVLRRSEGGYFAGANFPVNEKLIADETDFDTTDLSQSPAARRLRLTQLLEENKGRIDVAMAQRFLGDHYDTVEKIERASERTLCGHIDLSPRGSAPWQPAYGVAGAVQNKATDATMAGKLSFTAAAGHACGIPFRAAAHLKAHPEFAWQKEWLRDLGSAPWTEFRAADR